MLLANRLLRDLVLVDQVQIAVLNAAHANELGKIERHRRECREAAQVLYVAATNSETVALSAVHPVSQSVQRVLTVGA